ncbi:hypothetical protein PFLUV_G00235760 [Perca fluviatilis]|uniref:Uncharacterized protein n=1 Tax=Perca fluviatilis TaxID=8168 RepID=A0A6A5DYL7_PERFL|nr:hypothetical protein PFLUV_G00235760 [Perca fluviatilis]
MQIIECCLFVCGVLQLCSGQDINCTAAQGAEFTVYTISEVSRVSDVKPYDCEYSWTADNVIANHEQKNELVVKNTINAIVTSKCIDAVIFERSCISEGGSYRANCMINCTLNAPRFQKHQELSHIWIGPIVGVASIFLLGFLCGLCYKFKDKLFQVMEWTGIRRHYKSVMMLGVKPETADVETGS